MLVFKYHHNNSGGTRWIGDAGWNALEFAGWLVEREHNLAFYKAESEADAIQAWEEATGLLSDAKGCACCGPPHEFDTIDPFMYFGPDDDAALRWLVC